MMGALQVALRATLQPHAHVATATACSFLHLGVWIAEYRARPLSKVPSVDCRTPFLCNSHTASSSITKALKNGVEHAAVIPQDPAQLRMLHPST